MKHDSQKYYEAGKVLVEAIDQIGDALDNNLSNGTVIQKALALVSALQSDLCASFVALQPDRGMIVTRSIILRTIIENHGTALHIQDNEKRARSYLNAAVLFEKDLSKVGDEMLPIPVKTQWTQTVIKDRVSKIDDGKSLIFYDLLSNFTHGNNVIGLFGSDEQTAHYVGLIETHFMSEFILFVFMLVHHLEMNQELRETLYRSIERAIEICEI